MSWVDLVLIDSRRHNLHHQSFLEIIDFLLRNFFIRFYNNVLQIHFLKIMDKLSVNSKHFKVNEKY